MQSRSSHTHTHTYIYIYILSLICHPISEDIKNQRTNVIHSHYHVAAAVVVAVVDPDSQVAHKVTSGIFCALVVSLKTAFRFQQAAAAGDQNVV